MRTRLIKFPQSNHDSATITEFLDIIEAISTDEVDKVQPMRVDPKVSSDCGGDVNNNECRKRSLLKVSPIRSEAELVKGAGAFDSRDSGIGADEDVESNSEWRTRLESWVQDVGKYSLVFSGSPVCSDSPEQNEQKQLPRAT